MFALGRSASPRLLQPPSKGWATLLQFAGLGYGKCYRELVLRGIFCGRCETSIQIAEEVLTWPLLEEQQKLVWFASLKLGAVPLQELPPWMLLRHNLSRREMGVDLLSIDGSKAVLCRCGGANGAVSHHDIKRFLRTARWVCKADELVLVTRWGTKLSSESKKWLRLYNAKHEVISKNEIQRQSATGSRTPHSQADAAASGSPPLRPCQQACLEACANGARVIQMACGTGKTRVIRELAQNVSGKVLVIVPSRLLLEQFATEFPTFCKVGTGYNRNINKRALGFIAVSDSVHLLERIEFQTIFVDEAHHPLPPGMPSRWGSLLCDYDLYVPFVAAGHVYAGLVHLLLRHPGRFRRVLAYCNTVAEAKLVQRAFEEVGMEAWHINAGTNRKQREETIQAFCGRMQKPAHVLVTVQVLGEGVNIPNADTCMFVEPRDSYTSIVQAVGRVLRQHAAKPLAHIILPAVTMPAEEGTLAGGLKEAGLMSSSSDVVTCIPAGSYGQASDAHPLNRSLLVGSATAFRKASPLSDPAYEKPYRMIDSSSKSQHIHPAIHKLASGMLEGEFARKSDSQARAKGSQQAFRNIGGTVLHSPAHGPHNERAEDEYEQNLRTLDGSGSSSAEARALARASTASRKPSHSWTGDTQDPEQRVEDMLADTHMPNSARARAGSDNINDSVVTSSTVESALPSPEAMQRREAVSAAPLRQHVATHHRMKLSRVPDAQRDRSGFSQLERFLSVLGRADSRLAVPHSRMLGSRIWLVNCGSSAGFDTASVQSWLRLLAPILANPDPFEARVLQLEDFVEKHGRLPFPGRPPPEKQLSVWLKNTGALRILRSRPVSDFDGFDLRMLFDAARRWSESQWLQEDKDLRPGSILAKEVSVAEEGVLTFGLTLKEILEGWSLLFSFAPAAEGGAADGKLLPSLYVARDGRLSASFADSKENLCRQIFSAQLVSHRVSSEEKGDMADVDLESGSSQTSSTCTSEHCGSIVMVRAIEISRIALTAAGYTVAYFFSIHGSREDATRFLQLALSVALSGTCALEGACFYETAARQKGYDRGFDFSTGRNPYATQSTLWFASSCIVGVVAFFVYSRESSPQIVLATLQLSFFLMSALNHWYETVAHGNWHWQNMARPVLSLAMVTGAVPILMKDTQLNHF
ncbi:irc3 [Symbiodinium microadriaticum]|nr:irc3 [Symbiodinium microadriaticum]CAE7949613.1 irc3 [Symbiodinium sp. KB8]